MSDLDNYLVDAQLTAINTAALAGGQTDRFTAVMVDVSYRIRRKIQNNRANLISLTENAIPPELKWVACYLCIEAMQSAISIGLELTEDQRRAIARAYDELNRISKTSDYQLVSIPLDPLIPDDVQRPSPTQVVTHSCHLATRETLRGL